MGGGMVVFNVSHPVAVKILQRRIKWFVVLAVDFFLILEEPGLYNAHAAGQSILFWKVLLLILYPLVIWISNKNPSSHYYAVSKVCRSIVHFLFIYNSLTIFQKMGVTSIEYFCVTIVLFLCPPPSLFFFFLCTMCCPLLLGVFRGWWSYHVSLFLIIHISPQFGKRDLSSLFRIMLQLVCEFSIMFLSTHKLIQAFAYSNFVQCNIGHPSTPISKLVTETSTP